MVAMVLIFSYIYISTGIYVKDKIIEPLNEFEEIKIYGIQDTRDFMALLLFLRKSKHLAN